MTVSAPRPERIFAARDLLGETLQSIAASAEMSQGYLSEIATGTRPFTDDLAAKLAGVTGLPIEFFSTEAPDIEDTTLQFRKLKSAKAKTTKKAIQYFREASRIVQKAATLSGLTVKPLPYVTASGGDALENAVIEGAANATRGLMGIEASAPIPNTMRAIERLGIVVVPVLLDPTDEVHVVKEGHFGISHGDEFGIPLVGYFPGASPDRDRFTLSHEVGHILLHSRRTSSDPELEANRFAGALLMPEVAARKHLHSQITLNQLAHVKAEFGISIQALIMRAAALEIIDAKRQRSLFVQLSARGWRKDEPVEVLPEHPVLFGKLLEIALPENASVQERRELVALPKTYLSAMTPSRVRTQVTPSPVVPLRSKAS